MASRTFLSSRFLVTGDSALYEVFLRQVYKVRIRHDNSMLSPAWFLDKVEVIDTMDNDTYEFYCERWLAKNKDDCKIERSLYVKVRSLFCFLLFPWYSRFYQH